MEGFSWTTKIQTQVTGICIRRNAKESFAFNEIKLDTYCCREPLMSVHIERFLMRCRKPQNSEWVVHPFFATSLTRLTTNIKVKFCIRFYNLSMWTAPYALFTCRFQMGPQIVRYANKLYAFSAVHAYFGHSVDQQITN